MADNRTAEETARDLAARQAKLANEVAMTDLANQAFVLTWDSKPRLQGAINMVPGLLSLCPHFGADGTQPAGWGTKPRYGSVIEWMGQHNTATYEQELFYFIQINTVAARVQLQGTPSQNDASDQILDAGSSFAAVEGNSCFVQMGMRVQALAQQRMNAASAAVNPTGGAAGGTAGVAGGGSTLTIPKLAKLPKAHNLSQRYRHFKGFLTANPKNHLFGALHEALSDVPDLLDNCRLHQESNAGDHTWDSLSERDQVLQWLQKAMKGMSPELFAGEDKEEALAVEMNKDTTVTQYFDQKRRALTAARLSGLSAGTCDARIENDELDLCTAHAT